MKHMTTHKDGYSTQATLRSGRKGKRSMRDGLLSLSLGAGLLAASGLAGCKANPPVTDDALATTIQSQLASDSAIAGQQVTVAVQNGVATLNGTVANDAQRTIAARDAAGVPGVKEVINNIASGPVSASAKTTPPAPAKLLPGPALAPRERRDHDHDHDHDRDREGAPIERVAPGESAPQPQPQPQPQPEAPPPPPQPTFRNVTIPAGDSLPVRVTQTLDSATTQQGDAFSGVIASDILADGIVVIPAGTAVSGQVTAVHEAAHFKGSALLTVSLVSITRHGDKISVATDPYTVQGKGRGANTAEKTGGGAAVGAILGGIFGGGKGAAIGAAAGGGVGAGANGITRGQQVQIPSESVVRFRLSDPLSLRVRSDGERRDRNGDPDLQHHE
jgi:hypothetical protein